MSQTGREYKVVNGTAYSVKTPDELIRKLEGALTSKARIRVFYGDVTTGRDWMEEYSTMGTLSRSMGDIKIPLLIANGRSHGGHSVLDDCIVKITIDKRVVYKHSKYHQPEMEVREYTTPGMYPFGVVSHENEMARFKTRKQAERWVKFMRGESNAK